MNAVCMMLDSFGSCSLPLVLTPACHCLSRSGASQVVALAQALQYHTSNICNRHMASWVAGRPPRRHPRRGGKDVRGCHHNPQGRAFGIRGWRLWPSLRAGEYQKRRLILEAPLPRAERCGGERLTSTSWREIADPLKEEGGPRETVEPVPGQVLLSIVVVRPHRHTT